MRKTFFTVLSLFLFSLPVLARDRHQSYISFDEGQSILRQDDGREVEVRLNLPVFPGDEIETGRRGRTEVRLADGNIVAIDRNSSMRLQSVLDSYEGESSQTVAELLYGAAIVHALIGDSSVRLDSANATYVSRSRSMYSVEVGRGGADEIAVFSGSVEVRTPEGTERIRAGERARVDRNGVYSSASAASYGSSDFERWYIRRAERYGRSSRYLDRRIAYADYDLDGYGSWIWVSDYSSWVWRPYVSVGWRPYYHGRWSYSRFGSLVWVSHDPWGWVPYHYGRWAFSPVYGWVWLPGAAYSHAWVYWAFGPSYIGWIPAGFYDCFRPYYSWAYQPYARAGIDVGFGFYGRVRLANIDHRAWTFVDPNTLVSNRADRAALTTDVIRERLARDGDRATVANVFPKLNRDQLKDPGSAIGVIARRGAGGGTGKDGSGSLVDLTPFFRRDPELPNSIRERVARPIDGPALKREPAPDSSSGGRIINRGGGGTLPPETGTRDGGGIITRRGPVTTTPRTDSDRDRGNRDGRIVGRRPAPDSSPQRESDQPRSRIVPREREVQPVEPERDEAWRGRVISRDRPSSPESSGGAVSPAPDWRERDGDSGRISRPERIETPDRDGAVDSPRSRGSDDVPRRVIDRIGGARLEPSRPRDDSGGSRESSVGRPQSGGGGRIERPSSPPPQRQSPPPPPPSRDSGSTNIKPHE